jgi:type I restriction enzyme S subunit
MSWEMYNFTDLVNDITGGNRKFQSSEYQVNAITPIIDQSEKFISGYTNEDAVVKRKKDVVIFGDHTKALKYVDFDFCLGADGVKVLEPVEELDSKFLYYFLNTITLPEVGYSRHYKFLKETKIPLPPLATQKRIAEILDASDALRRKDQALLKKYDELAQAIFIDMFGDIKSNSNNLEEVTFKDICTLSQGLQIPISERKKTPGNNRFPYITNQFLNGGKVAEFIENPRLNVVCNMDDVLMTRTGNTGVVLTDVAGVFHNNFFKISYDKSTINKRYLVEYLKTPYIKATVLKMASTTTIPDLNHGDFYRIKFLLPNIDLQNKYGMLIEEQIKLRQSINLNLNHSDNLFNSLIKKAFKGELIA